MYGNKKGVKVLRRVITIKTKLSLWWIFSKNYVCIIKRNRKNVPWDHISILENFNKFAKNSCLLKKYQQKLYFINIWSFQKTHENFWKKAIFNRFLSYVILWKLFKELLEKLNVYQIFVVNWSFMLSYKNLQRTKFARKMPAKIVIYNFLS